MRERNDYVDDNVPGAGQILGNGTYWTQVGAHGEKYIRDRGMRSPSGKACIDIKRFGAHIYALWQS